MMLVVLQIWSVACLLWVETAAERNEKPNVVIMLMDDVSCRSWGKISNKLYARANVAYHLVLSTLISI